MILIASCDSSEPVGPTSDTAMEFDVAAISRSSETTSDNITALPFVVYSDMKRLSSTSDNDFIKVHDATEVKYNAQSKKWSYDNTQYWFPDFQYSFVALHPLDATGITERAYQNNRLKLNYTQPKDYSSASDILVSAHRRNCEEGEKDAVSFNFAHILTNMQILISYKGPSSGPTSIKVDNLILKEVPVKSLYSIQPAPLTGDSKMTYDWVYSEDSQKGWTVESRGSVEISFPSAAPREIQANQGAFPLFTNGDALLLLPNPADPDSEAGLELNYTTNTGETESVYAPLPAKGWEPGTKITLSMVIGASAVQMSYTVEDWKEGTTTNTTVPRI